MKYIKNKNPKSQMGGGKIAFTLVELIVVITILAVLSTIGFVSYSGYLAGTRDTSRIASLKAISEGLEMYSTRHSLPNPDEATTQILDNGKQIATQGYAGKNVLETITYSTEGTDPKDGTYYSYYLTRDKKYFQLMAFLEEEENLNSTASAIDYSTRYPKVFGKKLGILVDSNNTPIQELTGSLDISNVGNLELKSYLRDYSFLSGTGTTFSKLGEVAKNGGQFWSIQNNELVYYNPNTDSSLNIADIFGDGSNIATYTFDGNANDLNGDYNGTTSDITYVDGKFGKAIETTGNSSSEVDFGISDGDVFSISYWAYIDKAGEYDSSFGNGDSNRRLNVQAYYDTGEEKIKSFIRWRDGSTRGDRDYINCYGEDISSDGYHHFYINRVKETEEDIVYIDGKKITCSAGPDLPSKVFNSTMHIGFYTRNNESHHYTKTLIDQLRVFNRELTSDEVSKLYNEH